MLFAEAVVYGHTVLGFYLYIVNSIAYSSSTSLTPGASES